MRMTRSEMWSWTKEVLPFVVMLMISCLDMSLLTIVKAAMNGGMSSFVYIVYHNALGTLILLPFFIVHIFRNVGRRPPLTFHILFRFFVLGLLGICLFQVLMYIGLGYSSPTMASAISNLAPGNTFLLAVAFRMEKIDLRSSSSRARLFGTIIAISGAMVFTFYKGPEIFKIVSSSDSHNQLLFSQPSDWVFGGLIVAISMIFASIWNVLQAATAREYQDQFTIVFFFCLFGTIQSMALVLFLERNPRAWVLEPGIGMIAVVFGVNNLMTTELSSYVLLSNMFIGRPSNAMTWCLRKKGPIFVASFNPLSIVIASIMGVAFLGDSLHLGSAIGAVIVAAGLYSVMLGQAKEKKIDQADLGVAHEPGSSNATTPLLSSHNELIC